MKRVKTGIIYGLFAVVMMVLLTSCAGSRSGSKDIEYVTVDEEIRLGKEISQACNAKMALIRNSQVTEYLNALADVLGDQSEWTGQNYYVYVVDSSNMNHFSLPGGHIYLYRGLFDSTTTLEQTAMIIAHEIGHIASRDGIERIAQYYTFAFAAQSVFGYNPEITRQIINGLFKKHSILDYSHKKEIEADQNAVEYGMFASYNPEGLLAYLEKVALAETNTPSKIQTLELTHPKALTRSRAARRVLARELEANKLPETRRDPAFKVVLSLILKN